MAASQNVHFLRSSFTPSQYRAAEVLVEVGRGPCHLDLGEAVLACVEINQCARSPDVASIQQISAQVFAVARLVAAGRAAAGPWAAAHGAADHAAVRPWCFMLEAALSSLAAAFAAKLGPRPATLL